MADPRLSGFLAISKPRGMTSNTPVYLIRRMFKGVKVGQTGTLDPLATGLLVIAIGEATKLVDHLEEGKKQYIAQFQLGVISDSYDLAGVLKTVDADPRRSRSDIQNALSNFKGRTLQTPPIHSAVKIKGKPAYKLAREGKKVELKPRAVEIFSLELVWYSQLSQKAAVMVICSKGTYIRSLVSDIGETLGCGAVMTKLSRISSGEFSIKNSLSYSRLLSALGSDGISNYLTYLPDARYNIERLLLTPELARRFTLGQRIPLFSEDDDLRLEAPEDGLYLICRISAKDGAGPNEPSDPIGVGKVIDGVLHPERVLN